MPTGPPVVTDIALQRRVDELAARLDALESRKLNPNPTNTDRDLNSVFDFAGAGVPVLVLYTVDLVCEATQNVSVDLLIGPDDPPVQRAARARLTTAVLLGIVSIGVTQQQQLVGWVPPDHHVMLAVAGSGSATLVDSLELVFA